MIMPTQKRVAKKTQDKEEVVESDAPASSGEALKAEMDAILDEIDEVLEENAQEFVKSYVQKGGE